MSIGLAGLLANERRSERFKNFATHFVTHPSLLFTDTVAPSVVLPADSMGPLAHKHSHFTLEVLQSCLQWWPKSFCPVLVADQSIAIPVSLKKKGGGLKNNHTTVSFSGLPEILCERARKAVASLTATPVIMRSVPEWIMSCSVVSLQI